ncbi:DNA/RNA non-specific endonuclease [Methylococcus mesophilus]|uniref:DNA/RNA non-specific endonuclease n=1 Tax=Methylococcus mesophilus TaxID=2993564 RepID=UPI00224B44A8|nr:DNA/RNA non-specific endonuclease [Methylococcus mesophilus]UZR31063.1 DNA/RNA non-specific endonuclease [Methylococcus mesophilus]
MFFGETLLHAASYRGRLYITTGLISGSRSEIIECYRDIDELLVIGGVLWGTDASNDYFIADHGIRTPDAFWKVGIRGNGKTIAWIIPNDATATRKNLDKFLVTAAKIEKKTGQVLPEVPKVWRTKRPAKSWAKPAGCDLG